MNTTWHKVLFLGVLFGVIVILNIQPQTQGIEIFEDRSTNLLTADNARLLPHQLIGEDSFVKQEAPPEVSISDAQALVPLSGGPLEQNSYESNRLFLKTRLALAVDIDSGERLYELNTKERWPIASLSKLMTAVVATKFLEKGQVIQITEADFNPLDPSEFHSLKVGQSYTVEDLIRAMMIGSSNQAAEALSRSSGREEFIVEMKNQAVAWGMFNTYFGDPTGLSSANQSTLDDLEIFMGHIWREYPGILAYSKNSIKTLTDPVTGKPVVIYAINKFASRPDFLGGKTGYTDIAKENLISVFNVNNRTVLTIILGSDDRFGDTEILLGWAKNKLDI